MDNAIGLLRVAAVQPDRGMSTTVVLWDAEGGHGIASHPCEAVPFSIKMAVTLRLVDGTIELVFSIPPRFIQTNVGRARVKSWNTEANQTVSQKNTFTKRWKLRSEFMLMQRPTISFAFLGTILLFKERIGNSHHL